MTGDAAVAWMPVAAPIMLWTDETTALAVAACGKNYSDCTRRIKGYTYADGSKDSTE